MITKPDRQNLNLVSRTNAVPALLLILITFWVIPGCALHYFDKETGTEHIWGFGHMMMKVSAPSEGQRAIVRGTELMGFTGGNVGGQRYLTLGWEKRQRLDVIDENTSVRFEWPKSDFFSVRVGSEWPQVFQGPSPNP